MVKTDYFTNVNGSTGECDAADIARQTGRDGEVTVCLDMEVVLAYKGRECLFTILNNKSG
jgi:hypothetical protein